MLENSAMPPSTGTRAWAHEQIESANSIQITEAG